MDARLVIDEIDSLLLNALEQRRPVSTVRLCCEVPLCERAVRYRLNRLERLGLAKRRGQRGGWLAGNTRRHLRGGGAGFGVRPGAFEQLSAGVGAG